MSIQSNELLSLKLEPLKESARQLFNVAIYLAAIFALQTIFVKHYTIPLPATIEIAAVSIERVFPTISPWGPGFEREIAEEFGKYCGSEINITAYSTHMQAYDAFRKGKAHIFLATGFDPGQPAKDAPTAAGPIYESHPAIMLHNVRRYELRTPFELCDQVVFAPNHADLKKVFEELSLNLECTPQLVTSQTASMFSSLLELNDDKEIRFQLVEPGAFTQLQPFLHKLRPTDTFGSDLPYRWHWRTDIPGLADSGEEFWRKIQSNGTLEEKRELYFGFFPEETDFFELYMIRKDIREKLPLYSDYILSAAKTFNIDPLFAAAVMYQESKFDPLARSSTGVRGLMQLTNSTAGLLGISSRLDPEQSTKGGVIYLKKLWKWIGRRNVEGWNRWFFALAAYNQGIGHVHDAMDVSKFLNKPPNSWHSLKQVFPLLTQSKYHENTRYGYTRGYEAVDYVDSIRYYYYIFKGLSVIPGPEAEYLAPLSSGTPIIWP